VHQADVIYYGDGLLDCVAHEFKVPPLHPSPDRAHVPFWSDLAEGAESRDLEARTLIGGNPPGGPPSRQDVKNAHGHYI
jgi:hypothetical protein